jgi:hypothetical protein
MSEQIKFRCCICGNVVDFQDGEGRATDGYSLQVRKFGAKSPEAIWAHGQCLRKAIPVVGKEIPGPQGNV